MDDLNKAIGESIRNGIYFRDAQDWFAHRYIAPIVHRSMALITASLILLTLITLVISFTELFPITEQVPIVIEAENTDDYYPTISRLGAHNEDPNKAVARHILSNYILTRESYSPADRKSKGLMQKLRKVKKLSSRRVYKAYYDYFKPSNPDSPTLRYGNAKKRLIGIKSVKFFENNFGKIDRAKVYFEAGVFPANKRIKTKSDGKNNRTTWVADVAFNLSDVNVVVKTKLGFDFIVTDYNLSPVR